MNKKYSVPKRNKSDLAQLGMKAALAGIPYFGGAAAELFSYLITPSLENRRDIWREEVAKGLIELQNRQKIDFLQLRRNPEFITVLLQCSQAAIRNHQGEKREALRNAVLNTALNVEPSEDIKLIFVYLVDSLTVSHLQVLKFFQNPGSVNKDFSKYKKTGPYKVASMMKHVFPEHNCEDYVWEHIAEDLCARGLMSHDGYKLPTLGDVYFPRSVTAFGDQFIQFISHASF